MIINDSEKTIEKVTIPSIQRDLSWLSFNYRVLQEAKDKSVPLLERLKFLAIYSSNLDEFFRVRVSQHRKLVEIGKRTQRELDYDPKSLLKTIHKIVNAQQEEFSSIYSNTIIPDLRNNRIRLLRRLELSTTQRSFVEKYFQENLLPFTQPVLLVQNKIRVFLNNASLYLAVMLKTKGKKKSTSEFAIIKIPSDYLPRFVVLPSEEGWHDVIILDDIVRHSVSWMFPGFDIHDTFSFKLTRDAELYIDDEFSGDLIEKIKSSLQKRSIGTASRFVYDREMPAELLNFLVQTFELGDYDKLPEGRYHNNFDFFKFPDFGMHNLRNKQLPPLPLKALQNMPDMFDKIKERDHLINMPYHSYESVVQFFEKAAADPKVSHIKVIQYRVAKKSRIMAALINAVKAGKQVTVFIEVKARFDEESNLRWGETLQEAGVRVYYSIPGVKVHAKIALIRRNEGNSHRLYAYMSTGNFHEDTAKIYSDFGIFTADPRLTSEAARIFNFFETVKEPQEPFKHLLVGKFNLRSGFVALIDREIANAKAGKKARIIIKVNSLEDKEMISKLYEASQAGVEIKLIVRGICCLVPGIPGVSDNIEAISIVDRFLEHARVFIFYNKGKEDVYLSSADWMMRNLNYRIEMAFPVYNRDIKKTILEVIRFQLKDNVKARIIDPQFTNTYRQNNHDLAIRSQIESYFLYKRQLEESEE
jgi:polyphosphate kinase